MYYQRPFVKRLREKLPRVDTLGSPSSKVTQELLRGIHSTPKLSFVPPPL